MGELFGRVWDSGPIWVMPSPYFTAYRKMEIWGPGLPYRTLFSGLNLERPKFGTQAECRKLEKMKKAVIFANSTKKSNLCA